MLTKHRSGNQEGSMARNASPGKCDDTLLEQQTDIAEMENHKFTLAATPVPLTITA
jgi:hypothetical protein